MSVALEKDEPETYFIGVDCGTASVRAAVVSEHGKVLATASEGILLHHPKEGFYEQSSEDIWRKCGSCVRRAVVESGIDSALIRGLGFDATCSLVCLDSSFQPVSVSEDCSEEKDSFMDDGSCVDPRLSVDSESESKHRIWDIILWMDHRAQDQALRINESDMEHKWDVLRCVGGKISCEMQVPKMLWMKDHLPRERFAQMSHFLDLSDFLVFKATKNNSSGIHSLKGGHPLRSVCALTCKWTLRSELLTYYSDHTNNGIMDCSDAWNREFFEHFGLSDLVDSNKIGERVVMIGHGIPGGLCAEAAAMMGLAEGISVAVSMIDAHSGALGVLGAKLPVVVDDPSSLSSSSSSSISLSESEKYNRMALISGTSTCHLMVTQERICVPGVWGPYLHALIPGVNLLEAGQSATGALLDDLVRDRLRLPMLLGGEVSLSECYRQLNEHLMKMIKRKKPSSDDSCPLSEVAWLSCEMHVSPFFHGNRSPLSDDSLRGSMIGLSLDELRVLDESQPVSDQVLSQCAKWYLSTVLALCYESKMILERMEESGVPMPSMVICTGGLSNNPLFLQMHADVTGVPTALPKEPESVLVGAAVSARTAFLSGLEGTTTSEISHSELLRRVMSEMSEMRSVILPSKSTKLKRFHNCKYRVFQNMVSFYRECQSIMEEVK